jgi:hypothetical protein
MSARTRKESRGNAGAVESVESQKQASHSFHEPLGNLAPRQRDSHIPTARAKRSRKVENQNQVFHFPLALRDYDYGSDFNEALATFGRDGRRSAPPQGVIVVDKEK